uniref:Uncharacterized protein n=1 Tax=Cacopsylla melanoneura TaxID=428564 RepID=A0A8D8YMR1_9HEMI
MHQPGYPMPCITPMPCISLVNSSVFVPTPFFGQVNGKCTFSRNLSLEEPQYFLVCLFGLISLSTPIVISVRGFYPPCVGTNQTNFRQTLQKYGMANARRVTTPSNITYNVLRRTLNQIKPN